MFLRVPSVLSVSFFLFFFVLGPSTGAAPLSYERDINTLLEKYCYDCHGDGNHKAGLALDAYKSSADVRAARKEWELVLRNVSRHEMPAEDASAFPTNDERERIAQFIEHELFQLDPGHPDPGRVTLRRLNRAEYNNAIRDLVGVDFKPAADFPPDDSGYGFDNIGDVLSLPPVLLEKYLAAADKVLDAAIVTEPIRARTQRIPASLTEIGFNAIGDRGDGWVHLISLEEDDVAVELPVPAGDYLVRFQAFATRDGGALVGQGSEKPLEFKEDPGPTRIAVMLNDAFIQDFVVTTDEAHPQIYEARLGVPAGKQRFRASVQRKRDGNENETFMLNGRLGKQQPGIVFVKWLEIEGPLHAATRRVRADTLTATGNPVALTDGARRLEHNGELATTIDVAHEGEFLLRAQAFAQQAGDGPTRMELRIDGKPLQTFDVLAPANMTPLPRQRVFSLALLVPRPQVYEVRTKLAPGPHRFSAALVNEFADPENTNPNLRARTLTLQHLEVADLSAPPVTPPIPPPLTELFARNRAEKNPALAARAILGDFAQRAWRRPVARAEVDPLVRLYQLARGQGESFEAGVKLALKAALVSPHFLFQNETVDTPSAKSVAVKTAVLDEFALASRLSFFLWSSVPDDELLALAGRGQLRAQFEPQVRRMLASPKSHALVENFGGQWLQIRSLETMQPDKAFFPEFDPALRTAMQRETETFFEHVVREDRSVFDFIRGDYTFVNARLAKFYGLPAGAGLHGVTGEDFQRVSLLATPRRGVLTQASILTLTSNPTRTSPVKRGKWVLENILGTPPPPPPPNIPELDDTSRQLTGTLREQMEQHRTNATCASCHARMDPIGFGFENFNAIGAWRDKDGSTIVDASGKLASGDEFNGAAALADLLARKRSDDFRRCLAEKMLTYALGRGVEYYDRPAIERIMETLRTHDDKFSALILAVAQSFPFQNRRTETSLAATP